MPTIFLRLFRVQSHVEIRQGLSCDPEASDEMKRKFSLKESSTCIVYLGYVFFGIETLFN